MPKLKKKTTSSKKNLQQFIEHISDFSDTEYNDDYTEDYIKKNIKNNIDDCDDESDESWMYNYPCDNLMDNEEEDIYEDICESSNKDLGKNQNESQNEGINLVIKNNLDTYMSAAVWFNEMASRGTMSQEEKRYVELMIIELSKFYFSHLDEIKPSRKCMESIKSIYSSMREVGICTD